MENTHEYDYDSIINEIEKWEYVETVTYDIDNIPDWLDVEVYINLKQETPEDGLFEIQTQYEKEAMSMFSAAGIEADVEVVFDKIIQR